LLTEAELEALEAEHAEGITSAQLVAIFAERDVRLSEATFRKYVQRGLLPRSRRVGRKGKHRGSLGVYPAKTVRRVNAIKRLMGEGYTIEEIQDRFLRYTDLIEVLEESVEDVFVAFDSDLANPRFDTKARRSLKKEIAEARKTADDLLRRVGGLSERLSGPREDDLGPAGAAGSAEDLL
jgi:DNA-binding transcriptional MerR regulator